jgi:hypothetical protein
MRFSIMLAVIALAGCAGTPPQQTQQAPVEHQEKLNASNIVEAQKAGYTTTCLTEDEMAAMLQASHQSVEDMRRTQPPKQERAMPFGH